LHTAASVLRWGMPLLAAALVGCGGGGGGAENSSWLFPLWVPTDVAVADVDGDGRADVLTLAQYSTSMTHSEGRLMVYRQQANGAFRVADDYVVGTYPWRFAIADVDGDGGPDVVIADVDESTVSWLRQDPANPGHFLAPVQLAAGMKPYDVVVADLNGDGAVDIAATDALRTAQRIVLLPQSAAARGSFGTATEFALPGSSVAVAAGDLDGDGLADLAVGYSVSVSAADFDSSLAALVHAPGGDLEPAATLVTRHALNVERLRILDYQADGRPGLVAYLRTSDAAAYASELLALLPAAAGAPRLIVSPLAGVQGTDDAAFGDFDGDGRIDAAVAGYFPVGSPSTVQSRLNLFRQDATGALQPASTQSLPIAVSRITAGDVDGDGRLDLVLLGGDDQALLMSQSAQQPGVFLAPRALP
jgi:hypothetical protein